MSFWDKIRETDACLDQSSYYELLGVGTNATVDEISARYYELAGRFHPDRFALRASKDDLASLSRIYSRLGEAKRVLCDAAARADYDQQVAQGKMRVESTVEKRRKVNTQDPATPMARSLYEAGMRELQAGNWAQARAKLALAIQYENGSEAIQAAIAEVDERSAPRSTVAPAPTPVVAVAPPPVVAAPAAGAAAPLASVLAPTPAAAAKPPAAPVTIDVLVGELARATGAAPHELLGVPSDATPEVVVAAFVALVQRFDPELGGHAGDPVLAEMSRDLLQAFARARDALV